MNVWAYGVSPVEQAHQVSLRESGISESWGVLGSNCRGTVTCGGDLPYIEALA